MFHFHYYFWLPQEILFLFIHTKNLSTHIVTTKYIKCSFIAPFGTSLMVLWLRLWAEGMSLIHGQGDGFLIGKDPDAGKAWRQKEKGAAEDEMVRSHHQFNKHEFKQTLGDSEGQGNLAWCSPWSSKESDMS